MLFDKKMAVRRENPAQQFRTSLEIGMPFSLMMHKIISELIVHTCANLGTRRIREQRTYIEHWWGDG